MVVESNTQEKSTMDFFSRHREIILIIIFAVLIRLFTFFVVFVSDSKYWAEMSTFFTAGINPYETGIEFYYKYPPLFHYLINFFGLFGNSSYIAPKLMVFTFDILNICCIYLIGNQLKNEVLGKNAALFYAFNPIIILQFFHDVNEIVTLFFTLVAIYFLITERFLISSVLLTLGIAFKLYPIFFLIPILIYIIRNSESKKILKSLSYLLVVVVTFIIISLPFLIISYDVFIQHLFVHASRMNLGASITEYIPEIEILFTPAFEILGISISFQFIIQASVMFLIFIYFFFTKKEFNVHDLFTVIVIISLILPLINYQIQLKYTNLISFPFLVFIIYRNKKFFKESELYFFFLMSFLSILLYIFSIIMFFPPVETLISYSSLVDKGRFYVLFWIIGFLIFTLNEYRHGKESDYKIIILIVMPFITYNLFGNLLGVVLTCSIIIISIIYVHNKYWHKLLKKEKIFIKSHNFKQYLDLTK